MAGSEYGGAPGIIQPDLSRVDPEAAAAGLYHDSTAEGAADRRGVRDAAMILRRAGIKDARGVPAEITFDADGVRTVTPYSEEQAREDYLNGNNY
jgi:hypothetical protein